MAIVTLVSGGLDSTLMALLTHENGIPQFPLFINYGQRARTRELAACRRSLKRNGLPRPMVADIRGYGALISSGLTDRSLHVMENAFTPGRNLIFLVVGAAYAYETGCEAVAIGLLNERTSLFPDQTSSFLAHAEALISESLGRVVKVLAPLSSFVKGDVIKVARSKGITRTYSCHVGGVKPCGKCIACREFRLKEA
jgi:7-cyano-7-deazaguanine synthase